MAVLSARRARLALLAGIVAAALLTGGLPSFSGVVISRAPGAPAFTIDICYPLAGLDQLSGFLAAPPLGGAPRIEKLAPCGAAREPAVAPAREVPDSPDPPPPKTSV